MTKFKSLSTFLIAIIAVFTLSACADKAETTGEKIDQIASGVGSAIKNACEDVKETVKAKHTGC